MANSTMFPDEKTIHRRKVILTVCFTLAIVISVSAVAWRWLSGVDLENHAVRRMFSVVDDYMKLNDGQWPTDWAQLEQMPVTEDQWYRPLDFPLIKQYVIVDFEPDLTVLAQQSPVEFQAIRAQRPSYDFSKDPRLTELLNTIRRFHPPPDTNQP